MNNNDILRRVRYALDISNPKMVEIFKLAGCSMTEPTLLKLLKREEEDEFIECSNPLMTFFLDGLIIHLRGPRESGDVLTTAAVASLNNNVILKKLRIALNLKEEDMIAIMGLAGISISKSELTALFRNNGHKHFKECGDQFLRNFLKGTTIRNRPGVVAH
ncbi:MAG TPA: DUF1456 family protein [Desulfuromonadales bacterium]|nr:DUF1456 family protein [Desulfuromonadales bacterium]